MEMVVLVMACILTVAFIERQYAAMRRASKVRIKDDANEKRDR